MKPLSEVTTRYRSTGETATERTKHIDGLLANEATAALVCPDCHGVSDHCRTCRGFGVVCPTCRGARFVSVGRKDDPTDRYVRHPLAHCPSCCPRGEYDESAEQAAIKARFQQRREAA